MRFILTLHSHLPWVLGHGRWPHGSDWLCEAAVDTYLPLIAALESLEHQGISSPVTLGITPVLANQLAHPAFSTELEAFLAQRLEACNEAIEIFRASGEAQMVPLALYWRQHLGRILRTFRELEGRGGIIGAISRLARSGRIELISSAATHGFLPLLGRDESVRLQLLVGRREHRRLFGVEPAGCWIPECAYRASGPWKPTADAPERGDRVGIEFHLEESGYQYFYTDAHLARAGRVVDAYGDERIAKVEEEYPRSPYRVYSLPAAGTGPGVRVLVRDPETSLRVWSRHQGYPGDESYLEFHKIRFPGGLKLWKVTGANVDLGEKQQYDYNVARARAHRDAADFIHGLANLASSDRPTSDHVIVAPFDTELFGHWWFEGVDFLADLYRGLASAPGGVTPGSAGEAIAASPRVTSLQLAEGSWGAEGDFSMWLNPGTAWTWARLWPLEERFWNVAAREVTSSNQATDPVLAQASRELLLAQSSDWQFIISTGAAADYAERRFRGHCDGLEELIEALEAGSSEALTRVGPRVEALQTQDDLFPDILEAVRTVLHQS
jgi:1,4-alpha-glucan branching enzyme